MVFFLFSNAISGHLVHFLTVADVRIVRGFKIINVTRVVALEDIARFLTEFDMLVSLKTQV